MAINFKGLLDWKNWKKHWKRIVLGIAVFIILIIVIVLIVLLASGSGSGAGYKDYQQSALKYHNARREEHQVGSLELDEELTAKAEKCAEYYVTVKKWIDHTCPHKGRKVGENLHLNQETNPELPAMTEEAARQWYEEIKFYDFGHPGPNGDAGHFTAMIWKDVRKLGIGAYKTAGLSVVVALYSPVPNLTNKGKFKENVLPKKS